MVLYLGIHSYSSVASGEASKMEELLSMLENSVSGRTLEELWERGQDGALRQTPSLEDRATCTTEYLERVPCLHDEWSDKDSSWC